MEDSGEPWLTNKTLCGVCGHYWIATYPLSADPSKLECSKCGAQHSATFEETASEAIGEVFNGQQLLEIGEGEPEHVVSEVRAETMEETPGVTVFPLRLAFANGKTLVLHVSGWQIENG